MGELLLTWFPLIALSPVLFMHRILPGRTVHQSLILSVVSASHGPKLLRSTLQYDWFRVHP